MDINDIPRGQLSTIILTTLLNGDKYGYEIISEVEEKTNGELIIKKPSLYSSLSRMENQDLVSSYWKDSDIGGRRHYYRLTDYGRKQVLQWQEDLMNVKTSVSKVINDDSQTSSRELVQDTIVHQENLFSQLNSKENLITSTDKPEENKNDIFLQYDLFENNFISTPAEDDYKLKQQQVTVFNMSSLNGNNQSDDNNNQTQSETEQKVEPIVENIENQRIEDKLDTNRDIISPKVEIGNFDIEKEFSRYNKAIKSYADDVTSNETTAHTTFSYSSPLPVLNEQNEKKIEEETVVNNEQTEIIEEKPKSDAVYITDVLDESDFKVKKIEPASFVHLTDIDNKQPKKIESTTKQAVTATYYDNYQTLKQYFKKSDISIKVYGESEELSETEEKLVKVNKIKFFSYLIFFLLSITEVTLSAILLNCFNLFQQSDIYLFISYAVVIIIPLCYYSYKFIKNPNKQVDCNAIKNNPLWFKLSLIVLFGAILYCVNSLFGMTLANFKYYISTTILPFAVVINSLFSHLYKFIVIKLNKKQNQE